MIRTSYHLLQISRVSSEGAHQSKDSCNSKILMKWSLRMSTLRCFRLGKGGAHFFLIIFGKIRTYKITMTTTKKGNLVIKSCQYDKTKPRQTIHTSCPRTVSISFFKKLRFERCTRQDRKLHSYTGHQSSNWLLTAWEPQLKRLTRPDMQSASKLNLAF